MDDKNSFTHSLVLESRKQLTISGVKEVESFDEQNIIAITSLGEITVSGQELKINRFSTEIGELAIDGYICGITYSDESPVQGGFLSRIFR